MIKTPFPRAFYVPKDRHVRVRKYQDIPAVVAMYDDPRGRVYAVGWRGKAQKPTFHHRFRDAGHRDQYIARWLEGQREAAASKAKWRAERNKPHGLRVGQVLVCSWGYDPTNVDFYPVTRKLGRHMVEIRPIAQKRIGEGGGPSEGVVPHVGAFTGEPKRKRPTAHNTVRIASYANAYPWDGNPRHQTGSGWGH